MVSYTAVNRGQHKLHVQVNNKEIDGSPFTVTVYPDPNQLGDPVRVVTDLNDPYGIVYNSQEEMLVSELECPFLKSEDRGKFRHLDHLVTDHIRCSTLEA